MSAEGVENDLMYYWPIGGLTIPTWFGTPSPSKTEPPTSKDSPSAAEKG